MIYIIGVDHLREQFPHDMNDQERVDRFKKFICEFCRAKRIQLLAEEWSDDARNRSLTATTYCEVLTIEFGIDYLPCDPGVAESKKLGIKRREQIAEELGMSLTTIRENSEEERMINETGAAKESDRKREQYWLEQITNRASMESDVILVCGYGHADNFVALAKSNGYQAARIMIPS